MALRDVANTRDDLSGDDRKTADALLRRPPSAGGDGTLSYGSVRERRPSCTRDICVHSVARGVNRATPEFVAQTLRVLTTVHDVYRRAGYREPKPDGRLGGDARIDVYLGDIGDQGLYGYCTSDDPSRSTRDWTRWAYCTLDNDYSPRQFPTNTPLENLKVTAAHEYFHATQFAYDRYEDGWLLEATAAWVEDEMYPGVDDNLQYLRTSQLKRPGVPLDTFALSGRNAGFHYGTWSYFRLLTERFRVKQGRLPRLVLDVWRAADGARGKPDLYSWQAVNAVLARKGTSGARMLASYAVANRRPALRYREGRANSYPVAPLRGNVRITPSSGASGKIRMRHLTTATVRLTPSGLQAPGWRLAIDLRMAPKATGSIAVITTAARGGGYTTRQVALNRRGDRIVRMPFSERRVRFVEVTMVNGSGRFKCYVRSNFSCQGRPLDDRSLNGFIARAVR
jgi:hypothetical protein